MPTIADVKILLSNDDGIFAPGLMAMYAALAPRHHVDVVAPESVQSGGSHAITIRHPVMWRSVNVNGSFHGVSVSGTPADCVKVALHALLADKPDLIVSGINMGLNTGIHVLYSGTVAAAIEGAIFGYPAVAVSLQMYRDMDFDQAAIIAAKLIEHLMESGLKGGQVVNINIPEIKPGWPRGVRVVPQSCQPTVERIERRKDPNGGEYYWLSGDFGEIDDQAETDLKATREGYVCVTPLHFDLTDQAAMKKLQSAQWPRLD
jgi:5'-nucleotidase